MSMKPISVDDYVSIVNLMGAYQHLVDAGAEDGWADLFTADGAFLGMPPEVGPPDSFRGREGLKPIPRMTKSAEFRHFTGSFTVCYGANKDEAYADYYVLVLNWGKSGTERFEMLAAVKTHLVRIDGIWKIKSNTMNRL